jgi:hypothetical protein
MDARLVSIGFAAWFAHRLVAKFDEVYREFLVAKRSSDCLKIVVWNLK